MIVLDWQLTAVPALVVSARLDDVVQLVETIMVALVIVASALPNMYAQKELHAMPSVL